MCVLPYAVLHRHDIICGMCVDNKINLCIYMTSGLSCTRDRGHRRRRTRSRSRSRSRTHSRNRSRIRSVTIRMSLIIIGANNHGGRTSARPSTRNRIVSRVISRVAIIMARYLVYSSVHGLSWAARSLVMVMPTRVRDRTRALRCQSYSYQSPSQSC